MSVFLRTDYHVFYWQPFADVEVGMPGEAIYPGDCERMGIPIGSTWGHNAAEIRQAQQAAGMSFGFRGQLSGTQI
jgi:hypothetical protein